MMEHVRGGQVLNWGSFRNIQSTNNKQLNIRKLYRGTLFWNLSKVSNVVSSDLDWSQLPNMPKFPALWATAGQLSRSRCRKKFSSCSKMNLHWNPQVWLLKVSVKQKQNNFPFSHGGVSTGKIKADPNNSFLISLSSLFPPTFPFLQEINFLLHSIWWARLF